MVNPLISCFDWFVGFLSIVPAPAFAFMGLILALFFISSILRWFL